MSYDISLACACCGQAVQVPHHQEGGTYVLGGTPEAHLNVTYNYSTYYYKHLDPEKGIRWLYGRTGQECAAPLRRAIAAIEADEGLEREELASVEEGKRRRTEALNDPNLSGVLRRIFSGPGPEGYWLPTRANAAGALQTLLAWAEARPEAVFDGD